MWIIHEVSRKLYAALISSPVTRAQLYGRDKLPRENVTERVTWNRRATCLEGKAGM